MNINIQLKFFFSNVLGISQCRKLFESNYLSLKFSLASNTSENFVNMNGYNTIDSCKSSMLDFNFDKRFLIHLFGFFRTNFASEIFYENLKKCFRIAE